MNRAQHLPTYRELLLDGMVPFWARHGVDEEHGGVLSCMTEHGQGISTDKSIWSQARWVWTCAALYNRIARRVESPDFSETAPYPLPPNRRNHGVPMILTEVAGELARTLQDPFHLPRAAILAVEWLQQSQG